MAAVVVVGAVIAVVVTASGGGDDGADTSSVKSATSDRSPTTVEADIDESCVGTIEVLTLDDVENATGTRFDPPYTDESGDCVFEQLNGGAPEVVEFVGHYDGLDGVEREFEQWRATHEESVPGLGDEALYDPATNSLHARSGLFTVGVTYSETNPNRDELIELARIVFERNGA